MTFKEDLAKGEEIERKAIEALNKHEEDINVIKNPDKMGMDLLIIQGGIEVKFDIYAKESGNFYIEFECNSKPSGIFKEEKYPLRYWGHSDGKKLFLLEGESFKKWIAEKIEIARATKRGSLSLNGFMVVEGGGDGGRSKGLLVKSHLLEEMAVSTILLT